MFRRIALFESYGHCGKIIGVRKFWNDLLSNHSKIKSHTLFFSIWLPQPSIFHRRSSIRVIFNPTHPLTQVLNLSTLYGDEVSPIGQGRHSQLRNFGRIKHMFVRFCQKQLQKLLQPHISFRNFTTPCKVENHNNLVSTIC